LRAAARVLLAVAKKKAKSAPTIENRRARHDYSISDTLEVGVMLHGTEVKSVREGKVSLAEGYVRVEEAPPALWLHGVTIDEYGPAGARNHPLARTRKLLAHKREIQKLARQVQQKGMTIVPLKMYFKEGFAKLLIGLGQGRTSHDKRRAIAEKETKRDLSRAMSRRM
jgi:SsrA-binding protein